eukprot:g9395.t1
MLYVKKYLNKTGIREKECDVWVSPNSKSLIDKKRLNNSKDSPISYYLSLIPYVHQHIYNKNIANAVAKSKQNTVSDQTERLYSRYPLEAVKELDQMAGAYKFLFTDSIVLDDDPVLLVNKKQLEHVFQIQPCPCGSGLCANKSEIEYCPTQPMYSFYQPCMHQKCEECEGVIRDVNDNVTYINKYPLFSVDNNNYNNLQKRTYVAASLSGIRTATLHDFNKIQCDTKVTNLDPNMVKNLKSKLHSIVTDAFEKHLDAEWKKIDLNELLTLSVDGKAEHIANHENKGTSNFTVVITEEKTGKVLGLYNLNRKEELKHGKKYWSNQLEPKGIEVEYEKLKTKRCVKKIRIVHDACNGHVSNLTIAFFGEGSDAHCNWHKHGSILKFVDKLCEGKFDKKSGIEYVNRKTLEIGDIRRLLGHYEVGIDAYAKKTKQKVEDINMYEVWRDKYTPDECRKNWYDYVEDLTGKKKLYIHFKDKKHLKNYFNYNLKDMERSKKKTIRARTKEIKLKKVDKLTRNSAMSWETPVEDQWWTNYITIKHRTSHVGKDLVFEPQTKRKKIKMRRTNAEIKYQKYLSQPKSERDKIPKKERPIKPKKREQQYKIIHILKNAAVSEPIMFSRFQRIVRTYSPRVIQTLKKIVDQKTTLPLNERIIFVRDKWLNIVNHFLDRHTGCFLDSECRKRGYVPSLKLKNSKDAMCLRYFLRLHYFSDHSFFAKICYNAMTSHTESFNSFVLRWVPKHLTTTWDEYDTFIKFAAICWNTRLGKTNRHLGIVDIDSPFIKQVLTRMWNTRGGAATTPKRSYIPADNHLLDSQTVKKMKKEKVKKNKRGKKNKNSSGSSGSSKKKKK